MALTFPGFWSDDFFNSALRALDTGSAPRSRRNDPTTQLITRGIPLDIKETDNEYDIKADIPGVDKKDISLSIDGDVLTIAVSKEEGKDEDQDQSGVRWHRTERTQVFTARSIRLPDNADPTNIQAKYDNGVLELKIPKSKEEQKTQRIDVQ